VIFWNIARFMHKVSCSFLDETVMTTAEPLQSDLLVKWPVAPTRAAWLAPVLLKVPIYAPCAALRMDPALQDHLTGWWSEDHVGHEGCLPDTCLSSCPN